jgi:hypothetical protein
MLKLAVWCSSRYVGQGKLEKLQDREGFIRKDFPLSISWNLKERMGVTNARAQH